MVIVGFRQSLECVTECTMARYKFRGTRLDVSTTSINLRHRWKLLGRYGG